MKKYIISKKNKNYKIIPFLLLFLIIIICGCFGETGTFYQYNGVSSEIILSSISIEEKNNVSLRNLLKQQFEMNFFHVSNENDDMYIWYNETIYVGYNELEHNKWGEYQYSKISFLSNNSILIRSKVTRSAEFAGGNFRSRQTLKKEITNLYEEDKEFLNDQNSKIIKIIRDYYETEIIFEEYTMNYGAIEAD